MKRIIVIGSPGAGKSTFARQLRDIRCLIAHLNHAVRVEKREGRRFDQPPAPPDWSE